MAALDRYIYDGPRTDEAVDEHCRQLSLSRDGAVFAIGVFGQVTIYRFQSPSRIPDEFVGRGRDRAVYVKGRNVGFSPAAILREQNRGIYSGDR